MKIFFRETDSSRVSAIKNNSPLIKLTRLQAFLRLAYYYQIYIYDIQNLRSLLNTLLKKRRQVEMD